MRSIRHRAAARALRAALALVAAVATACAPARRPAPAPAPVSEGEYLRSRKLMVPVDGIRVGSIADTFNAKRDGARIHQATDILAPRGTRVLAADDGRVVRVSKNELGGNTLYLSDPTTRFVYYYAHLDRYEKGIRAGMKVSKGQVIGFVGTTGNAPPNAPHLHFQAMRAAPGTRTWEGAPVDVRQYFAEHGAQLTDRANRPR